MTARVRGAGASGNVAKAWPLAAFAALCYVPLLLTAPGVVVADTKSYLTIDPGRLLSRASSMWDPHIGMGTVTHQNIGYLWPLAPYYWAFERLGAPDWVAQRIWLGSILLLAGLGMRYLLRSFRWNGHAVGIAMVAYALTPYVLTVAARISVILLPFAALPWLLAFAIRAPRTGGWRHPALFALVVATVGSSNATALVLVGVAPLLWFPFAVWVSRETTLRTAAAAMARIGVLTIAASLWWIAGLSVQASNGLDVLRYTETADAVATASSAPEVLRGLGYWFFFGDDRLGPWIEPSVLYTQRLALLGATYLVPTLGLLGGSLARWRHRAFFVGLLLAGMVLSVGAHPWDNPSIAGRAIKAFLLTDRGLAMRSLPRAIPLVALSLAVLLGAGAAAYLRRRPWARWPLSAALIGLCVAILPPLWQRGLVPQNLRRPEELPSYWRDAADHLTESDNGTRVLEIPGSDFASYRWGNTVDPITTGLTDRPVVARELVPFGSPASADLLNAFDERLQQHIAEPDGFAPIARLMRAGQVLVRSDLQYERYSTPRPRELWALVQRAPGLSKDATFGPATPNVPAEIAPLRDELELTLDPGLADPPPVGVFTARGTAPIIATQASKAPLVVAGDGAGLVDLASAGLLRGDELVLMSAALDARQLSTALADGAVLILTDTNRRAAQRWATVRNVRGYTEPAGRTPLRTDLTDNRLPVFPMATDDDRTVALHRGGISADATSYGNPIEYTAEDRAAHAVDGDPTTAWRTGAFSPIIGEHLRLTFDVDTSTRSVTLVAPDADTVNRWITKVRLRFDGGDSIDATLGPAFRSATGQAITFPERRFRELDIEVLDDTGGHRPRYGGLSSTGFAEVRVGSHRLDEVIRLPVALLADAGAASLDHPLAIVVTRKRAAPTEAKRDDEERSIVRSVELPTARSFSLSGQARLSTRATDALLDELLGRPSIANGGLTVAVSSRLPALTALGSAAFDGNPATVWSPAVGQQRGQWVELRSGTPITIDHLPLRVLADGYHSVPTRVRLEVDGKIVDSLDVPALTDGPRGTSRPVDLALPSAVSGTTFRLVIETARVVETTEGIMRERSTLPVGVAEVGLGRARVARLPKTIDTGCRRDLLQINGHQVGVRVAGPTEAIMRGDAVPVALCRGAVALTAGANELRTALGRDMGIDLDRLTLRSAAGGRPSRPSRSAPTLRDEALGSHPGPKPPGAMVTSHGDDRASVRITGARPGQRFWLTLGQSFNDGWRAKIGDRDLGAPTLVDGFANGWLVDPRATAFTVDLRFTPQHRVDVALQLSAVAALLCALLAIFGRRAILVARADEVPLPLSPFLALNYDGPLPTKSRALGVALLLGFLGAVVAPPIVGLVLAVVAYRGMRDDAFRRWIALGAPAALVLAAAYIVVWQLRYGIAPGFEWPTEFGRAHPVAWMAVLLLVADVVIHRAWTSPEDRDVEIH